MRDDVFVNAYMRVITEEAAKSLTVKQLKQFLKEHCDENDFIQVLWNDYGDKGDMCRGIQKVGDNLVIKLVSYPSHYDKLVSCFMKGIWVCKNNDFKFDSNQKDADGDWSYYQLDKSGQPARLLKDLPQFEEKKYRIGDKGEAQPVTYKKLQSLLDGDVIPTVKQVLQMIKKQKLSGNVYAYWDRQYYQITGITSDDYHQLMMDGDTPIPKSELK